MLAIIMNQQSNKYDKKAWQKINNKRFAQIDVPDALLSKINSFNKYFITNCNFLEFKDKAHMRKINKKLVCKYLLKAFNLISKLLEIQTQEIKKYFSLFFTYHIQQISNQKTFSKSAYCVNSILYYIKLLMDDRVSFLSIKSIYFQTSWK